MRPIALLAVAIALSLAACQAADDDAGPAVDPAQTVVADAPAMPVDAPPQEEVGDAAPETSPGPATPATGEPGSCLAEIGATASARLVERCVQVSPATRPPCNAANPCEMIQGEIDRSCAMFGPEETRPAECAA